VHALQNGWRFNFNEGYGLGLLFPKYVVGDNLRIDSSLLGFPIQLNKKACSHKYAFKVSETSPTMSLLVGPLSLANQRCEKCASCSFKIRSYDSGSTSRAKEPMKRCLVTVEMREQDVWPGPGDELFIYYNENDHLVHRDNYPKERSSDLKHAGYYYTCTGYECSKFIDEHSVKRKKIST
jgi:hypothetical protein